MFGATEVKVLLVVWTGGVWGGGAPPASPSRVDLRRPGTWVGLDVCWILKTHDFVGLIVRRTVKTRRFVGSGRTVSRAHNFDHNFYRTFRRVWSYRDEGPLGRVDRGGLGGRSPPSRVDLGRAGTWVGLNVCWIFETRAFVGLIVHRTVKTRGFVGSGRSVRRGVAESPSRAARRLHGKLLSRIWEKLLNICRRNSN